MINGGKSKIVKDKKAATFTFHYHRPFAVIKGAPKDNDLELSIKKTYTAQVRVYGLGKDMKTEIAGEGDIKI